jgi:hypothetical protein
MSDDDRTWTATHDRTPYENLRTLMRHIDPETPTSEIIRLAFIRIPGLGPGDDHIVERVREEFAEEHALARTQRWLDTQEEPPTITIPDARTRTEDDGTVVPDETVRATIDDRLRTRSQRACLDPGPDSVIDCTGPDGPGYCCPACEQQQRREEAIIEALLDTWEDHEAPIAPQTAIADRGEH